MEKRRLRPGRRTALAAGLVVVAVLGAAFAFREELIAWWVGYRFIWLPEGVEARWGKSLNAAGQLLVVRGEGESDGVWSVESGSILRLDPPSGIDGVARAHAINERGHVVGAVARVQDETNRPFLWTEEGGMQLLSSPGTGRTWFNEIDERDEAVGSFEVATGVGLTVLVKQACLWTPQRDFLLLDRLSQGNLEQASAINGSGWVVGCSTAQDGRTHPVRWRPPDRLPQDLGLPAGFQWGAAVGATDSDAVLVNLWNDSGDTRPFLWTAEQGYVGLPLPQSSSMAVGLGIDREGTVLVQPVRGSSAAIGESGEKSFLIRGGKVLEIPGPWRAVAYEYHSLTDHGWLIGRARLKSRPDSWQGFIARPVR